MRQHCSTEIVYLDKLPSVKHEDMSDLLPLSQECLTKSQSMDLDHLCESCEHSKVFADQGINFLYHLETDS